MSFIIIIDIRRNNGHCVCLEHLDGEIAQFDSVNEALDCMKGHILEPFPFYIFDLDKGEVAFNKHKEK